MVQMEKGHIDMRMDLNIQEYGVMVRKKDSADIFLLMETYIRVTFDVD